MAQITRATADADVLIARFADALPHLFDDLRKRVGSYPLPETRSTQGAAAPLAVSAATHYPPTDSYANITRETTRAINLLPSNSTREELLAFVVALTGYSDSSGGPSTTTSVADPVKP